MGNLGTPILVEEPVNDSLRRGGRTLFLLLPAFIMAIPGLVYRGQSEKGPRNRVAGL